MLLLHEKVKVLELIKEKKTCMLKLLRSMMSGSSIHEIIEKEKEICASFAASPQTAKVTATVHGKCLVRVEQAFLWGSRT